MRPTLSTRIPSSMPVLLLLIGLISAAADPASAQDPAAAQSPAAGARVVSIDVQGLQRIGTKVVTDQMISAVGEPFDPANTARDERALERLGVFSRVEVQPRTTPAGIALDVTVVEIFPLLPYVSVQVSDQSGTSAGPGIRTVAWRGRPVRLSLAARFGAARALEFIATTPWRTRQPRWTEFNALQTNRQDTINEFRENSTDVTLYSGTRRGGAFRIGGLVNLFTLGSDTDGKTIASDNRDVTVGLGGLVRQDTRDEVTSASRGWWNEVEVTRTVGDGTRWVTNIDFRRFQPISPRQTVVLTGLLTMQSGEVGRDVPVYRQYVLGGTNTVRGWGLGASQGQHQFIATAEYRVDLIEPKPFTLYGVRLYGGIQVAAFADFGSAWGDSSFDDGMIDGAGIGLRFIVPYVNLIRIDFAFGEPGGGMRRHFGLDEKSVQARMRIR